MTLNRWFSAASASEDAWRRTLHFITRKQFRLFLFLVVAAAGAPNLRADTAVQEFFVPMPEKDYRTAATTIQTNTIGTNINTIISLIVSGNGTVIWYDHWEDGYEVDPTHPAQISTLVWGDGIDTNGIAPGFTHDPVGLTNGTILSLT